MLPRQYPLEQIAPWLISGASGWYIVARARKLSQADPSQMPLPRFLAQQSDVLLLLCGSPAIWHVARRAALRQRNKTHSSERGPLAPGVAHQLRQVFTVMLLGLGMITRKAKEGRLDEVLALSRRLQQVIRTGAYMLVILDQQSEGMAEFADSDTEVSVAVNGQQPS